MSHFALLVQLSGPVSPDHIENEIAKAMAPFNEELDVPEYETECVCLRLGIKKQAEELTAAQFGDIIDLHNKFDKLEQVVRLDEENARLVKEYREAQKVENVSRIQQINEQIQKLWREFIKLDEREEFTKQVRLELKGSVLAEKDCETCQGSGVRKTTFNPKSKWDFYSIGNGWPEIFGKESGSFVAGSCLKKRLEAQKDVIPFALLTKNGSWHEEGTMGLFGFAFDANKKWPQDAANLIQSFEDDDTIVLVNCHI